MEKFNVLKVVSRFFIFTLFTLLIWQSFATIASAETFKFPWKPGAANSKRIGGGSTSQAGVAPVNGWHGSFCGSQTNCALDLFAEVGATDEQRAILAAASGTITDVKKCTASSWIHIKTDNTTLHYLHLRTSDFPFTTNDIGKTVNQGDLLGYIAFGNFSEACGYTAGQPSNGHLHLDIIYPPVTMDGWYMASKQVLTKNGATAGVGSKLISTNDGTGSGFINHYNPRELVDVTGDGKADAVGFGNDGIYVGVSSNICLANGSTGSFSRPTRWSANMGSNTAEGWKNTKHIRTFGDVDGDGDYDAVGFGDDSVWVAQSSAKQGLSSFKAMTVWSNDFTYNNGGWRVEKHPRMLADVDADGDDDIIGFGDSSVWVAKSRAKQGSNSFEPMTAWSSQFTPNSGGWSVEKHPRFVADVNNDRKADLVGFHENNVYVALSTGNGFGAGTIWSGSWVSSGMTNSFGGWKTDRHVRAVGDIDGDGDADLVGFGEYDIYVATNSGGRFLEPRKIISAMTYSSGGWRVEKHPRALGNIDGITGDDFVGFGDYSIYIIKDKSTSNPRIEEWNMDLTFTYNGGWR